MTRGYRQRGESHTRRVEATSTSPTSSPRAFARPSLCARPGTGLLRWRRIDLGRSSRSSGACSKRRIYPLPNGEQSHHH
jgi:hypothetical protein